MAASRKNNKVEAEIERHRCLHNWDKALEVTRTQWTKSNNGLGDLSDVISNLLQGEKELETYLLDNPPSEENVDKAKESLVTAERNLRYVSQRCPKEKEMLKQEAVLLLGKLLFAQAKYTEALREFENINLDKLVLHSVTNRMLKILAEGLAVKAMCMEKLIGIGSMPRTAENEDIIVRYYEQAGDHLLVYLQNRDTVDMNGTSPSYGGTMTVGSPANPHSHNAIGSILEMAVQKSPLIYIEKGQIGKGVGRFRELLRSVEPTGSKNLYKLILPKGTVDINSTIWLGKVPVQTLARQLAEVLLRGVCSSTYTPIKVNKHKSKNELVFKAKQYVSKDMFVPSNEEEEALLLLLIAEGMANKEAVLERRPEHTQSRLHTYDNATAVYDLLAIALVRRSNCTILCEALERAMKFSYEEPHVWYQFALSLIETGKFDRAYQILKECHRLKPKDPTILLMQAKLAYDKLLQVDDGIALCEKAVELCDDPIGKSKALMLLATGYSYKLADCRVRSCRELLEKNAFSAYNKAYSLDSNNTEAVYRLALHLAQQRKIKEALRYATLAIQLQPDHMNSLTLLSLLFSAEKKYEKALEVIKIALGEHPDTFSLLLVKSKLEAYLGLLQLSLSTCCHMLRLWKKENQAMVQKEENRGTGLLEKFTDSDNKSFLMVSEVANDSDWISVVNVIPSEGSIRDSVAASRVEKALSEVASSYQSSLWVRQGPQHSLGVQAQIWLHLAEIYLENDNFHGAHQCVREAMIIFPLSYLASYMKGRVLEREKDYTGAKSCFEAALSINPYHVKSMTYLGKTLHAMAVPKLAEKTLRDAVNIDPTAHRAWRELGVVLESVGEYDTAADCLITSIDLECSTPVVSFNNLLRVG